MTYTPDLPEASQTLGDSQAKIATNFTQLNTIFGEDHVEFDAASNRGKHNKATFVEQAAAPSDIATDELAFYSKADGADTEVYASNDSTEFQVTKDNLLYIGAHPAAAVSFTPVNGGFPNTITPDAEYNIDGTAKVTETAQGEYTITFANSITDAGGSNTNDYMFTANAMDATNAFLFVGPQSDATYSNVVNHAFIKIQVKGSGGATVSNIKRVVLTVWKVQ